MIKTISQTKLNREFSKHEKTIKTEPVIVYKNNEPAFVTIPIEMFEDFISIEKNEISLALKRYFEIKNKKVKVLKGEDAWQAL